MCPVCMSTTAIVVSGGAFTGCLSSLLVRRALGWGRGGLGVRDLSSQDGGKQDDVTVSGAST